MLLVVVEEDSGGVAGGSLEAATLARSLAEEANEPLHAVTFGARENLAEPLSRYGVATLHLLTGNVSATYSPQQWGAGLANLIAELGPSGVIAAATDRGNETLADAAARGGHAFASNCVAARADGNTWQLTRLRGGGILLEDAELADSVKFLDVASGAVEAAQVASPAECGVEQHAIELPADMPACTIVERATRDTGVSLSTAPVIVSGGRGVGSAEGFGQLEELAALLGGAVGCSRVATNAGWRPHSDQVGLTGTKIAADLYIACGISGATQHWVGCMGAKTILAINNDPEAALVLRSDYSVIGDLHEVLPAVVERVRARKELPSAA